MDFFKRYYKLLNVIISIYAYISNVLESRRV